MREFGELEAAIMDALWRSERPLAVREVRESMDYGRTVAYTTVMTVADILFHKGLLERKKAGRAWLYWPRESREEHTARVMSEVFSGCGDPPGRCCAGCGLTPEPCKRACAAEVPRKRTSRRP